MTLNNLLFSLFPAIALFSHLFLFLALLTARKNRVIYSFMGLLAAFILWTGGALFMRLQLFPGVLFWWKVSLTGIFLVPCGYYLLFSGYTGQKGYFLKLVWIVLTVIMIVANLFDAFIYDPAVVGDGVRQAFHFKIRWTAVFPIVYAVCILSSIWFMVRRAKKGEAVGATHFRPLALGVFLMAVGIIVNMIPSLSTLSTDSVGCALNAICIYYAFYKKRMYALSQIASKGPIYLISVLLTTAMIIPGFPLVDQFIAKNLGNFAAYHSVICTVFFSVLAILIFSALNWLYQALYVKEQIRREDALREFSASVNRTLNLQEIVDIFLDFLRDAVMAEQIYMCIYREEERRYVAAPGSGALKKKLYLNSDSPLCKALMQGKSGILYESFRRSVYYKAMWEEEKRQLREVHAKYILPIFCEDQMVGFSIFSEKRGEKEYKYEDLQFMESVASIVSIAIKNANLYETMHYEAQLDSLTGLYNRRYFNQKLEQAFAREITHSISVLLLDLDDFGLYNELYGNGEGDQVLQKFASIITMVVESRGTVARYGGNEFAVLLPYSDAEAARGYALRIKDNLEKYIDHSQDSVKRFLTFSAGIAAYPSAVAGADQLVSCANLAVYSAKKKGKNRIECYSGETAQHTDGHGAKNTVDEYMSTIYALTAAIDAKDHYTFNHSQCVAAYAAALATEANMDPNYVEIIRQAGLLHDIGKISIPDAILTKTGALTDEEFMIMRQHVERSISMIRHLPSLDYVIPLVLGHHERYDGKGYPRGIAGEQIPIGARCLAIVDSFDAMISRRSYKSAMSIEEALQEIERNLGTQFDPRLGRLFVEKVRDGSISASNY